jgi:tRNA dimethylallyltransferase
MSGIGYKELCAFLAGATTYERAVSAIKTSTHRLARMQATWFKDSDRRIHWFDPLSPTLASDALQRVSASAGGALS